MALLNYEESLPPDSWKTAYSRGVLGRALLAVERFDEAQEELTRSHQVLVATKGRDHWRTVEVGESLERVGQRRAAAYVKWAVAHQEILS